jgi:hypothetical protein
MLRVTGRDQLMMKQTRLRILEHMHVILLQIHLSSIAWQQFLQVLPQPLNSQML